MNGLFAVSASDNMGIWSSLKGYNSESTLSPCIKLYARVETKLLKYAWCSFADTLPGVPEKVDPESTAKYGAVSV